MTRTTLQIGDLDMNDQVAMHAPSHEEVRAARREQTERRLGYAFLAIVGALGFAVLMAGASLGSEQVARAPDTNAGLYNSSMSQLFDVSRGVRRL